MPEGEGILCLCPLVVGHGSGQAGAQDEETIRVGSRILKPIHENHMVTESLLTWMIKGSRLYVSAGMGT